MVCVAEAVTDGIPILRAVGFTAFAVVDLAKASDILLAFVFSQKAAVGVGLSIRATHRIIFTGAGLRTLAAALFFNDGATASLVLGLFHQGFYKN